MFFSRANTGINSNLASTGTVDVTVELARNFDQIVVENLVRKTRSFLLCSGTDPQEEVSQVDKKRMQKEVLDRVCGKQPWSFLSLLLLLPN